MTDKDLAKFVRAQDAVRDQVTAELRAGRKASHWMWFVFPQARGLGASAISKRFAIEDLDQARRYLADPVLGERLREDVRLMLTHGDKTAQEILGSPDAMKFRSCLTLFGLAASNPGDRELFARGLEVFYSGRADELTMAVLDR